jgi:ribosomal protein S18 acetylase RimI-like enzyme
MSSLTYFTHRLIDTDYQTAWKIFLQLFERDKWEDDFQMVWRERLDTSIGVFDKETKDLIAFALFAKKSNGTVFLEYLAVANEYQNLRLGTTLLHNALSIYPSLSLVPLNDAKIINWYKKNGFKETSRGLHKWGEEYSILSTVIC